MSGYVSMGILLLVSCAGIAALYPLGRVTSIARESLEVKPFLSGWQPEEHALSRYHARYYPLTLLFLAFDVEMLFMYPWAVVVASEGGGAVIEMFVFLGVLMAAVVWAWREGALRWV